MGLSAKLIALLEAIVLFGYVHGDCNSPLGLQSGDIPNSDITASSEWAANHGPSNARLNRPAGGGKTGAWSAKANDKGQWIQVNFRQLTRVTKVAIQGRQEYPQWVTAFKISYSLDGRNFQYLEKVYHGNNDQNSVVVNTLMTPIEARFVRLHPYAWYGHISMRMELYGCSLKPECRRPLGMENYRVPDSAITSSSQWDANHGPSNARLDRPSGGGKTGAWSARTNDVNQWIQVTFSEITKVTGVGIQGRYDYNQWVTKFKVSYSLDGIHFSTLSKVFNGNNDRNTIVVPDLEAPFQARVVRINPLEWYGHISLRMEFYGCQLSSECATPLGMENRFIPNYAITASSEWAANHGASNARLYRPAGGGRTGAWSAKINDKSQWIQVDLRGIYKVTKVLTQGRQDYAQWVTQFKISYSLDGTHFTSQNKVYQANSDQNTVVVNVLEKPIDARFIRLLPQLWHGHISLRMELYGCSLKTDCSSPMGMENKLIPDFAITASSEWNTGHGAKNGRLYFMAGGGRTGAWSAKTNDRSQWIQVDLGEVQKVTQIASQGRSDYAQWVTSYRVSYSTLGKDFQHQDLVYRANSDQHSVVVNSLVKPIEARFVRIMVEGWKGHISMRFEVYGCHVHAECETSLGLTNKKLPNSALRASSEWNGAHGASNARLYHVSGGGRTGAWSAKVNNKGQWLEVDLGETTKVTMVATQGRYDYDQWVQSYKVAHSKYGDHFEFQNKVYEGNKDRNSVIINKLIQPIEVRFVRIYPESWHGHMSMRAEFYGCTISSECSSPLGMENYHIPDSAITASSLWDPNHGPNNARIYHMAGGGRTGAWSAKTNDKGQWIQVNLSRAVEVTKIGIQGRHDYAQWVTKFRVAYSTDGQHFTLQNQEYSGNRDQNTLVINDLAKSIKAQYVRILPQEWHGHISLRMELYGCDSSGAIDGGYSEWKDWGICSATCGGGTRSRSRSCNNPVPQNGGADCSSLGPSEEFESCNKQPCKGYGPEDCDAPLGIQSGEIPNSDITASSEWAANHGPSNARLNRPAGGGKTGAWSAKANDKGQWIQVNLRQLTRVTKVAIQGRQDHPQWVSAFKISHSLDGKQFEYQDRIYDGSNDQNSVVMNTLMEPVIARFVRLHPYVWYGHISLRMELYGCSLKQECLSPLGMETYRIPNSAITASSEWDVNHGPTNARLNRPSGGGKTGAWSAKRNDESQWIQVTFPEITKVTGVAIQGRYDYNQWVTKFKVSYSLDGIHFVTIPMVYNGNKDRNGIVINDLEAPIEARIVRYIPVEWYGHISLRMELYGCHLSSECATPLGMENRFIPDYAITASTEWAGNHGASNARLHPSAGGGKTGAWSSRVNDKSQWIQVDL
ncbi:uncharacterized protein LOC111346861 [Stylophora pistillata]|uniref:uncharacterized protein LOC111346861 n=1 Tax=Stylophora pistillata TaxID=50429 RepID=UPI000C04B980|nr:uncharacterized protein LOC111346861 [Stylophora pistillata]